MPLTKRSLVLPASPPSVKLARSWVSKILEEIGREDLVDAAQLGVSELVTNALIHSHPPLSVRVRGTVDHPRIEVVDSSPVPPQRAPMAPEPEDVDDFNVTTFGRGLDLVAMMSSRWGSDLAHDGRSKSVWFEPSGERAFEAHLEGEIFDFDPDLADGPEIARRRPDAAEPAGRARAAVRRAAPLPLRGTPRAAPARDDRARRLPPRHRDHRDLRPGRPRTPHQRRHLPPRPGDRRRAWRASTWSTAFRVSTRRRWRASATCSTRSTTASPSDHLLALRPPEVLVDLQNWYFTEFERQGNGEEPMPLDRPDLDASCMTPARQRHRAPLPARPGCAWRRASAAPWVPLPAGR